MLAFDSFKTYDLFKQNIFKYLLSLTPIFIICPFKAVARFIAEILMFSHHSNNLFFLKPLIF